MIRHVSGSYLVDLSTTTDPEPTAVFENRPN